MHLDWHHILWDCNYMLHFTLCLFSTCNSCKLRLTTYADIHSWLDNGARYGFLHFFLFGFFEQESSLAQPWNCYVAEARLELLMLRPPSPPVLELQVCTIMPGSLLFLEMSIFLSANVNNYQNLFYRGVVSLDTELLRTSSFPTFVFSPRTYLHSALKLSPTATCCKDD